MNPSLTYVFRLFFKISFRSLKVNIDVTTEDYLDWSKRKNRTHLLLNKVAFSWVEKNTFHNSQLAKNKVKLFVFNVLYELLQSHLSRRILIYNISTKYKMLGENFFVYSSLALLYWGVLKELVCVLKHNFKARGVDIKERPSDLVLAIGFPEHSFSISDRIKKDGDVFFSFGEFYLNKYHSKQYDTELVSVDEYVRPSKRLERKGGNLCHNKQLIPKKISRHKSHKRVSVPLFMMRTFKFIYRLIFIMFQLNKNKGNFLLELMYCIYKSRSEDLLRVINSFEYKPIAIYAPLFTRNIGLLPYLKSTNERVVTYMYGQNIGTLPTLFLNKGRKKRVSYKGGISDLSPGTWTMGGRCEGFTDVVEYLNVFKKFLNDRFLYNLPNDDFIQPVESPLMLGYETLHGGEEGLKFRYIIVFDVPPSSRQAQMSEAICGDLTYDLAVVEEFLLELTQTCIENKLKLFIKPKYSIKNYSADYRLFLTKLLKEYETNLYLLDPYCNTENILKSATGCVSMPYTSMKLIAEYMKLPSIYYLPRKLKCAFYREGVPPDLYFGRSELSSFLGKL